MSAASLGSTHNRHHFLETRRVIIWEADARSWQITYVSPQAVSLLGYPIEKWHAPGFLVEHLHPEDREGIVKQCRELMASHDFFELKYRMLRSDGSVKWFHDLVGVTREQGNPRTIRGCMVEVDEIKDGEDPSAERSAVEKMHAEMATAFVNLSPGQVDSKIEGGLQALVEGLDTDRATLGQVDPLTGDLIVSHSWARPGCPTTPRVIAKEMFSWSVDRIKKGEIVFYSSPEELPSEASAEQRYLLSVGVKSALVVPLDSAGEMIGAMATESFQRRRDWDPGTISRFVLAGTVFCNALARKRAGEELQKAQSQVKELKWDVEQRLGFEALLAELSAQFVNLPADQVDGMIEAAQKHICEVLGLQRSTLAQLDETKKDLVATHGWVAPGFSRFLGFSGKRNVPWMVSKILNGERIQISRVDDLPQEAAKDKETLRQDGLNSNVTIPLFDGDKVFGAIAFGTISAERKWPEGLIGRLHLIAQVFASVLVRKRSSEALLAAFSEIAELKNRLEMENIYLRKEITGEFHQSKVTGQSTAIRAVLTKARQVAGTDSVVLIVGETGTGKELIASIIHQWSRRKDRTMIKINCAALPATLIESELFGREKGAYTGALSREIGRFELADKSTILLDEIGELPMELQAKLLRVLQEGEFERLGSSKTLCVDTRVIAATSRDLSAMVKEGKFREDLFYRLNVFPIRVPPLRERREDIPALMWDIIRELGTRMGRNVESIQASTLKQFQEYSWPGNVRELRNIIERYLIMKPGHVFQGEVPSQDESSAQAGNTLEQIDSAHILQVLTATRWRVRGKGGAAEILGLKPTTLEARMKKLKIHRPH
jgi:formate hydrogenlyase transcriptional activator